ncbi:MAG: hypothetical protein V3T83_07305, partial [Acidobacteriota bacterium]
MGIGTAPVVSLRSTTGYKLPAPPAQNGSAPCADLGAPRKNRVDDIGTLPLAPFQGTPRMGASLTGGVASLNHRLQSWRE